FQADLPARKPRDIEQVVDKAGEMLDLALDDLILAQRGVVLVQLDKLQSGDDRRQGVAQLVPEQRQKLVLGAVCPLQLDQELGVLFVGLLYRPPRSHLLGEQAGKIAQVQKIIAVMGQARAQTKNDEAARALRRMGKRHQQHVRHRLRPTSARDRFNKRQR